MASIRTGEPRPGTIRSRLGSCTGARRPMHSQRLLSSLVALTALVTFVHCAKKGSSNDDPRGTDENQTCTATQALQAIGLRGTSMPPKAIALTFDDGPGPRTKQLSLYLKNEGIQAAFFVNGRSMGNGAAEILQALVDDGHLVANHTETHRSITGTATGTPRLADGEIVEELTATDLRIDPFVPSKRFLFRPPFGDYDDAAFNALAASPMNKYVGPILWDVGDRMDEAAGRVADWDCWQDGSDAKRLPMQTCGDLYVTEIKRASRGIVLLHDPYFNDLDPEQLGTVDMIMYMVPLLKADGFTFMRVDHVPEIEALLPALEGADGGAGVGADGGAVGPGGASSGGPCR
jgi:peptidoglycan-N-acetylglucosamine deacetylase